MSRVTRRSMDMLEQTVNASLGELGCDNRVRVGKDAAGYGLYNFLNGKCESTIKYGLSAKELYTYLEGMLKSLYMLRKG